MPQMTEQSVPMATSLVTEVHVVSANELQSFERSNIQRALKESGGKISGQNGAASRLGIPPSTLTSRMKALGIERRA